MASRPLCPATHIIFSLREPTDKKKTDSSQNAFV